MTDDPRELREEAAAAVRKLDALGLNRGSTGNLSVRWREGCLITPSGMEADGTAAAPAASAAAGARAAS